MLARVTVENWMTQLKRAWVGKDVDAAVALFKYTKRYFERPFYAATTEAEIRGYWNDIRAYDEIEFDYQVAAVEDLKACVTWDNKYTMVGSTDVQILNGVFLLTFDENDNCAEFRMWWFQK